MYFVRCIEMHLNMYILYLISNTFCICSTFSKTHYAKYNCLLHVCNA